MVKTPLHYMSVRLSNWDMTVLFDFVNQGRHGKDFKYIDVSKAIDPATFAKMKAAYERVTGLDFDTNVLFKNELIETVGPKQARANKELKVGQRVSVAGHSDPVTGLIHIALGANGNYRHIDSYMRTLMHEAFHNLQDRLLTKTVLSMEILVN